MFAVKLKEQRARFKVQHSKFLLRKVQALITNHKSFTKSGNYGLPGVYVTAGNTARLGGSDFVNKNAITQFIRGHCVSVAICKGRPMAGHSHVSRLLRRFYSGLLHQRERCSRPMYRSVGDQPNPNGMMVSSGEHQAVK